jgi:hypothetical protein
VSPCVGTLRRNKPVIPNEARSLLSAASSRRRFTDHQSQITSHRSAPDTSPKQKYRKCF